MKTQFRVFITLFVLGLLVAFSTSDALAKTKRNEWQGMQKVHVSEALKMADETKVIVEGQLIEQVSKDTYILRDVTGKITVEIDKKKWGGRKFVAKQYVTVYGEMDVDGSDIKIEAKRLSVLSGRMSSKLM